MNFLETILAAKREETALRKKTILRSRLEDMPGYGAPRLSLSRALAGRDMAVVAEIKKASPSRRVLREDFDPLLIARQYLDGGAHALSVLTDEKFFQGKLDFIGTMRHAVSVPILRKDFIIDSYQLYEARAYGADAVLLIVAALDQSCLYDLAEECRLLGMQSVVEVHTEDEIDGLDFSRIDLVGINNRDLMTFDTDVLTSVRLRKFIPAETGVISESGIRTPQDLRLLMDHHIHAVLIGEQFMKADNPGVALRDLLAGVSGLPA